MRRYQGIPASPGIGYGPAWIYHPVKAGAVSMERVNDPQAEWMRLNAAMNLARRQLLALEEKTLKDIGEAEAAIFQAHREFLDDVEMMNDIKNAILCRNLNAEAAVKTTFDEAAAAFAELDDPYFKARAQDIKDVADRLLRCLQGKEEGLTEALSQPSIIIADDLTPSDTVQFDKTKILGLCTAKGGPTSHTAILARSLGVPAVVSVAFDYNEIENDTLTILDGENGEVVFGPALDELETAKEKRRLWEAERQALLSAKNQPAATLDGHRVEVVANIGGIEDAEKAVEMGAEGVGLFRTEFLYLDRTELLNLDEQIFIYKKVMDILDGRPLVVRTLDIGGDKSVPYLGLKEEANPFLGWRGIRMIWERPDILANQFEALLLAGVNADLRIMLPMVSGVQEVKRAREIFDEVRSRLTAQGKAIASKVQFGIMIEVPSAALLTGHLAPIVDFFSIGTNDLTQYTLAVDRTNDRVAALASPYNPAVLKLIAITIEEAHKNGKWVGLCGELAGEKMAVPLLLGMGLDEFSMAAPNIPGVKQTIRQWSLARAKEVAQQALSMGSHIEVINYLKSLLPN
ncbi:MAG: phosphoenolpyruvate--protein phosphotransferase [Anaerolineae bacterium]|nr:phosphoenolpyruvate--protein phosphotransferase [Anaerolineae bacterium]